MQVAQNHSYALEFVEFIACTAFKMFPVDENETHQTTGGVGCTLHIAWYMTHWLPSSFYQV
jgi:hypothetical protein